MLASAGTKFQATTTLSAETGNNTSAADSFLAQTNDNAGAGNISKVDTRTLLYPGATSRIFAHFLPWFGFGDHMSVGYTSNDALQIQKQVNDMLSRGMNGAIIDWYGRGEFNHNFVFYDQASQLLMHQAEAHPGFQFAIMYDSGALKTCAATVGCDLNQTMIADLNYVATTYEGSPAYLTSGGRPVILFFGTEAYTIDWNLVRSSVANNPLFIFRNSSAFMHMQTNGGFSWVAPETVTATDLMGIKYLDNYDSAALSHPTMFSLSSGYKGFNDTLAAWGTGRIIGQQCGQTWLQTLADAGKHYSSTNQLLGIQLVTWNDYEEGSEIETGIDNCVSIAVSVSGTVASWAVTGQLNTIDHYSVYVSQDGEDLMWLTDAPVSAASMNLAQFSLNAGNYIVFVKAIGKPSLTNKMSAGVQLTVLNQPPTALLGVTPTSGNSPLTVSASTAGSSDADGNVASTTIDFGDGSASVNAASASHLYVASGTYTVKAVVTDNLGASSTATALVNVINPNKPPVAALSLSASTAYAPAGITASTTGSTDPDGTIATSSINFGDGSAAVSAPSATHSYSAPGTYTVTATVTDNLGASSSASNSVTVKAPEVIVASPAAGAQVTSPIQVTATGFSGNTVTAIQIYLDGTLVVSVKGPSLDTSVAASVGTHTLVVKGWDSSHKNFFTTVQINVAQPNQPPVAALSLSTASLLQGASVTASTSGSTDPDGSVASSSIDFGDGTASVAGPTATHQFTTVGTYTMQAVVTDNDGASSMVSKTVTVKPRFVTISSPTFATTTSTSVHVVGTAFSGYAITATQVYLDGVLKFKTTSATADTTLPITRGTHTLVVKGWDTTHTNFFSSVTFTKQ